MIGKTLLVPSILALSAVCGVGMAGAETRLQLSTGINYSSGDFGTAEDTDVTVVPFTARVTVDNWAFRASLPFVSVDGPADVAVVLDDNGGGRGSSGSGSGRDHPEDDGSTVAIATRTGSVSGIGDLALSATYSFNEIGGSSVYVDATGRVRVPTGDESEGLGGGATDYGLAAELGSEMDWGGVYVSGGRRFLGDEGAVSREDGWQAGTGLWLKPGDKVEVGAGVDWREASFDGGEDPSEVSGYLTYKVTPSWRVGVNASAGLSDASPDFGAGLTLTWRGEERRQ